jgi:copper(I)-binding protein
MIRPLVFTVAVAIAGAACAGDAQSIVASHAWIRILPGALPAGGYVQLQNTGTKNLTLAGVRSASYHHAMLHQSSTEGGMGRMAMVDSLALPAGKVTALAPGGYHIMLADAPTPVKPGDTVTVTLVFGDGSTSDVAFAAKPANAL